MHQARKRFGQNFLTDGSIVSGVVRALAPESNIHLLEIGPGLGALTLPLLSQVDHLDILEIDRDLVSYWQEQKQKQALIGLNIIEGDALEFDFLSWAQRGKEAKQRSCIIGNLPYNISSPLLFHLISAAPWIDEQVFMLQAEVVERITAAAGDSEYSRLSVMLQARYYVEQIMNVPPEAFEPKPKVNSAVVRMIPRRDFDLTAKEWDALSKIVAMAFAQRRKMLRSNLHAFQAELNLSDEELKARAQEITVGRYIEWAKVLTRSS
jgi:16S rRNA (adenine1518-N6/adenine1519-N6)-dimethyltransferase